MTRKDVKKYVHFNVLHKDGKWRTRSRFESIQYAKSDETRGVVALFNYTNSYLSKMGYSAPLFAIVWDESSSNDAYVFYKVFSINEILERRISKDLAELYENNGPDENFLYQLFELPLPTQRGSPDTESSNVRDVSLYHDLCELMSLEASEREQLIKSRVGQGRFREDVIRVWGVEKCAYTLTEVKEILIASHVKAWKDCDSTNERLDGANGILLCANLDRLFDQHLITFIQVGNKFNLKFGKKLDKYKMKSLGIDEGESLDTSKLSFEDRQRFEGYLSCHQKFFEKINDMNIK